MKSELYSTAKILEEKAIELIKQAGKVADGVAALLEEATGDKYAAVIFDGGTVEYTNLSDYEVSTCTLEEVCECL